MQKTFIIGHLGKEPELRQTQNGNGNDVCSFSVATTERWKDQQGQQQERTEWHNCVAWGPKANLCAQYLHKGSKVYIEGKNRTRKYSDQNNVERYITEIHVSEIEFLSPNGSGNQLGGGQQGRQQQGGYQQNNRQGQQQSGYQGGQQGQQYEGRDIPDAPQYGGYGGTGQDVPF